MNAVLVGFADGVLTLTLNRPEKRNAINTAVVDGLAAGIARAELDAEVRVLVIRGEGRDFCTGADLDELLTLADHSLEENERHALMLGELFIALRALPKPTVAVVQGRALAGGAGLATACDLVLASENSRIGYPEIERGFVPAMVMTMLRRAVGEKRAGDLVLTGRLLSAREAEQCGLVSRVLADEGFEDAAAKVAATLAGRSATALALTKQLLTEIDGRSFQDGILLGARVNALSRATDDFKRAITAFLGK